MARLAEPELFEAEARSPWLMGARRDLLSFFAPAALVFALFLACVAGGVSPLPFLWLWLGFFDGPHNGREAGFRRSGRRGHGREGTGAERSGGASNGKTLQPAPASEAARGGLILA